MLYTSTHTFVYSPYCTILIHSNVNANGIGRWSINDEMWLYARCKWKTHKLTYVYHTTEKPKTKRQMRIQWWAYDVVLCMCLCICVYEVTSRRRYHCIQDKMKYISIDMFLSCTLLIRIYIYVYIEGVLICCFVSSICLLLPRRRIRLLFAVVVVIAVSSISLHSYTCYSNREKISFLLWLITY